VAGVLEELHIGGFGVIEQASLEFAPGLNVLSGETGAGKTMVTGAIALALGGRAAQGLVRVGARSLSVDARFRLDGPEVQAELSDWAEDDEVILARTVAADGKSKGSINGRLAPASALATAGSALVEIHGQNQAERLAAPGAQMGFLDRFAGAEHLEVLDHFREIHAALRRARETLDALDREAREREREKDLLAYQVREIESARVEAGEAETLAQEERRLANAERILELAGSAEGALGGEDGSATDRMRAGAEALRSLATLDTRASNLSERLASLAAESDDVLSEIRRYRESVELDPGRLAEVRERIQALKGLERKYGDGEEGILRYLDGARARLLELESDEGQRAGLSAEIGALAGEQAELAGRLSKERAEAAPRLGSLLTQELQELGMSGGRLDVELTELEEPGADGAERVDFLFSGGPAQPQLPLGKVASGGELSRTMLACRSVLADVDDVPTLVFDEVDAGIGGRAAVAVANRLEALARHRQVLVVTHLAQIAARADRHFVVTKEEGTATVRPVDGDERLAELARMLSGTVGQRSLAHARELIGTGGSR
jgi:DNA repair protein RecN (Recombination protein N)